MLIAYQTNAINPINVIASAIISSIGAMCTSSRIMFTIRLNMHDVLIVLKNFIFDRVDFIPYFVIGISHA